MNGSPEPREEWMQRALDLAVENVRSGNGGPFGAVITRGGELVAEGANRVTADCDPTAHAEVVAIRRAAAALGSFDLSGCEIYSSCEPCPMCFGAILWSRLDRIWYAATQNDAACSGFDDSAFYEQIRLAPEHRQVPMARLAITRASEPFDAWRRFSAKVPY